MGSRSYQTHIPFVPSPLTFPILKNMFIWKINLGNPSPRSWILKGQTKSHSGYNELSTHIHPSGPTILGIQLFHNLTLKVQVIAQGHKVGSTAYRPIPFIPSQSQGSDQYISLNLIKFQFKLDSGFFNEIQFQFKSDSQSFNSIPIQFIFFQF